MKIKVSNHKLNIHYRGSPWGSGTQQHAYCLRYAHSHHIESHLGNKPLQANIPVAFLFSQLHFNYVTSHALFYGGHLVMRSAKPGKHLKLISQLLWHTGQKPINQIHFNISRLTNSELCCPTELCMQVRTSRYLKRVAKNKTNWLENKSESEQYMYTSLQNGGISYVSVLTSAIYQHSLQCFHPRFR